MYRTTLQYIMLNTLGNDRPPIQSMALVVKQFGGQAVGTFAALGVVVHGATAAVLGPPFQAFMDMLLFLRELLLPIVQVLPSLIRFKG